MLGNWVRCTTTTTGTGDLTLSAVTGYPAFSDVAAVGRYVYYTILDDSTGQPIETGIGHLSASTTFVRDKILATFVSSVYDDTAPSAVSLASGTKRVINSIEAMTSRVSALNINTSAGGRIAFGQSTPCPISGTSLTVTADRCYYLPIVITSPREIDGISCRVSSGVGSTTAKVALYSAGLDGKPQTRLYQSSSFSTGTGASGVASVNTFTQHRPMPGLYFMAFASSGAVSMNSSAAAFAQETLIGTDSTYVQAVTGLYEALSGGWTDLPSTANSTLSTVNVVPLLGIRIVT